MTKKTSQKSGNLMEFSELSAQWLLSISHGLKESTLAHYRYTMNRYILPVFGGCKVKALNAQQLEQGILQVIAPADGSHLPLGASSSRECLTMLRRICKYAAHLHLMRPVEIFVKLPPMEQNHTKPFTVQEQEAVQAFVLQHISARTVGLLLQMQLGLRIGEVCGLQWGDFDLETGTLTVRRTVSRIYCGVGRTKVVVQTPKTKSSGREIPIPRELVTLLRRLQKGTSPGTWFLSGNAEKPVEPRCYRKSIRSYLRRASVRRVHPHALRHTFATTCLQTGCDIKTLSEIMGHTDANITLKRYVHSDMKRKRCEMERIFAITWQTRQVPARLL